MFKVNGVVVWFFSWFDTREARRCGTSLAELILRELPVSNSVQEKKFAIKAEKTLNKVICELAAFRQKNTPKTYWKAKFGNAFLWTLKDSGVSAAYADELTKWLTLRF